MRTFLGPSFQWQGDVQETWLQPCKRRVYWWCRTSPVVSGYSGSCFYTYKHYSVHFSMQPLQTTLDSAPHGFSSSLEKYSFHSYDHYGCFCQRFPFLSKSYKNLHFLDWKWDSVTSKSILKGLCVHSISLWLENQSAAAAKSLQSCPILCDPIDSSPPGSAIPGILQARTLEWVAISFSNAWKWKVKVKSFSRVRLLATL